MCLVNVAVRGYLLLAGGCLALLVKGHDHYCRAMTLHNLGVVPASRIGSAQHTSFNIITQCCIRFFPPFTALGHIVLFMNTIYSVSYG